MSLFVPEFDDTVPARDAEAEVVGRAPAGIELPADSSARPHVHRPHAFAAARDNHFLKSGTRDGRHR
ncbi:hypothetical protein ACGFT2_15370 [Streptomyces sp. NPDC048514]|uniref:hypothetical protein n=1 Tax=Streptomyces sp. NPDC048514 TaxID=3365564 RepID=UPI0037107FDE